MGAGSLICSDINTNGGTGGENPCVDIISGYPQPITAGPAFNGLYNQFDFEQTGIEAYARLTYNLELLEYIPKGFAHGFLTLSQSADVLYKATGLWNKKYERTTKN